jgi:hypothetical protein
MFAKKEISTMYEPSAFLIAAAALTSIFSFFFGMFFRERELTYRMWIKFEAYGATPLSGDEKKEFCAELESRRRMYYYFKGITGILLMTLIIEFVIFQFYSLAYINPASRLYDLDAFHSYLWYNSGVGIIVIINCLEILYMRVTVERSARFPYIRLRPRVESRDRLALLWRLHDCPGAKRPEYATQRIPRYFYKNLEPPR